MSAPTSKKLNPVEEDYISSTVHAGESTAAPPIDTQLGDITEEDEDTQEITVQTGSSWYPPLPIPEGVDQDNFQGDDNHPLHRGRWIIFLGYNKENSGSHYGQKYCETLSNRAHFKINGSGEVNSDDVFISALTRVEVRQPMTIDFDFEIKEAVGQDNRAFQFALCTPDPRDGFIQDSNLYGRVMWSIQALVSGSGKTHFWSIEIRAGWEHKLYLLFRGNLDTPEKRFPPCTLDIASNKGFARRLDFLETHNESWVTEYSGAIVQYLISEYFAGVFTADWIAQGIETSLDSDGEMVGSLIQKLASMNGFIFYVDFNKCLHFLRAENEESQSNLVLREAEDVLDIVNRMVDEIINSVTVNGASDSYTAEDAASIASYWKRERSFSDESLTSANAVQSRAEELLAALKDPFQEIPIKLPEVFLIELYDRCVIDCSHVGLENEEISVKSTNYSFSSGGYRTTINGLHKGFSIAELLADTNRKLQGIT